METAGQHGLLCGCGLNTAVTEPVVFLVLLGSTGAQESLRSNLEEDNKADLRLFTESSSQT